MTMHSSYFFQRYSTYRTLCLSTLFCLPLCGTVSLFALLAFLLLTVGLFSLLIDKAAWRNSLNSIADNFPLAYRYGKYWLIFIHLSLIVTLSTVENQAQQIAATARIAYILIEISFALSLLFAINNKIITLRETILSLTLGFCLLAIYQGTAIYQAPDIYPSFWSWTPLLSPNIRDAGTIAAALALANLSFYLFSNPDKHIHKVFYLSCYCVCLCYVFWTGGRTAIAVTLFTSVLALIFFRKQYWLSVFLMTLVALGLSIQLSVYPWNSVQGIWKQVSNLQNENRETIEAINESPNTSDSMSLSNEAKDAKKGWSSGRWVMWKEAFNAIKRAPFTGLGPNGWLFSPERREAQAIQDQPHNLFLQVFVEWGLIGGSLFLLMLAGLLFGPLKQLHKHRSSVDISSALPISLITVLSLHSLTSGTYWNFQSTTIVTISYVLLLAAQHSSKHSH